MTQKAHADTTAPELMSPAQVAAGSASSERLQLRRAVLSYKYEVDRLYAEYQRLHGAYSRSAGELVRIVQQYNAAVERMGHSRMWRIFRKIAAFWHLVRYRRRYECPLKPLAGTRAVPAAGERMAAPELPTISAIDYEARPTPTEKVWDAARFLSFKPYNQVDQILARQPEGERRIFIQAPIIDWFVPLYQRPQHMALAMARQGYLVFYMTANTLGDHANGFHEIAPDVFITNQPVHLMVQDALVSCYSTVATLLSWQGGTVGKVRALNNHILYEYIDHIDPEISFHTTNALSRQFALVDDEHVDMALASATSLLQELEAKLDNTPVAYVPNGVDTRHYDDVVLHDARATVPPAMREVVAAGRPIVGYFGAMAPWLWYPTMNELARSRPDLSFVYIGPDYLGGSAKLDPAPNVYAIGAVDYAVLPYHAQHFDVAIIPFKPGDIARTTSPLKLFEYFALGKPVVVTRGMEECEQFDEVLTAASVDEYATAIDQALRLSRDPDFAVGCRRLAGQHTWDKRAGVLRETHDSFRIALTGSK